MKNLRFTLGVCVASMVALVVGTNQASAQQGKYVTEATARLTKMVNAGNKAGYSLSDNSFSIGGGWLKQSKTDWVPLYDVELKAGKKYRFIAAGDNDAKDVDLEVLDANNKVVAQDAATDPTATVDFTPTKTGRYLVRIRLYASQDSEPCVCVAIVMTGKK